MAYHSQQAQEERGNRLADRWEEKASDLEATISELRKRQNNTWKKLGDVVVSQGEGAVHSDQFRRLAGRWTEYEVTIKEMLSDRDTVLGQATKWHNDMRDVSRMREYEHDTRELLKINTRGMARLRRFKEAEREREVAELEKQADASTEAIVRAEQKLQLNAVKSKIQQRTASVMAGVVAGGVVEEAPDVYTELIRRLMAERTMGAPIAPLQTPSAPTMQGPLELALTCD